MRYKFTIEYDGTNFPVGWQSQKSSSDSVQTKLKNAALALTGQDVVFHGAGRTDAGVHALGQVAHIDLSKPYGLRQLHLGMNYYLKNTGCKIIKVEPVSDSFHARFNAKMKAYCYHIVNSACCSVFEEKYVWLIPKQIDLYRLKDAVTQLIGSFDFTSMCDATDKSISKIKTMQDVQVMQNGSKIEIRFMAKSFLHKQVRIMVGTIVGIGTGVIKQNIQEILAANNRVAAGVTAPAYGLFLEKVLY